MKESEVVGVRGTNEEMEREGVLETVTLLESKLSEISEILRQLRSVLKSPTAMHASPDPDPTETSSSQVNGPATASTVALQQAGDAHVPDILRVATTVADVGVPSSPAAARKSGPEITAASRRVERKAIRQQEADLRAATDKLHLYQVTNDKWSASARALICRARHLMKRIDELGMESITAMDDHQRLSKLIRDEQLHSEFFGCNLSRYIVGDGWDELARSYDALAETFPLIEHLERRQAERTKSWQQAFLDSAAAESRVFKLIDRHAPDCRDSVQLLAHDRLVAIQGDIIVPPWANVVGVDELNVDASKLTAIWGRLQKPEAVASKTETRGASVNLLDSKAVLDLHWELVRFFLEESDPIDPPGTRDDGLLESALSRPSTGLGGVDKYETVTHKAAALTHSLILNHPFHNGNKRTALASLVLFLRRNDLILTADEDELFSFMLRVAAGELLEGERDPDKEVSVIRDFIHQHTASIGQPKAMKLSDFVRRCEKAGCTVRTSGDKRSLIIGNDRRRITLRRTISELDGPVVKVYVSRLGLTETHSGLHLDTFAAEGELSPQGIIAKYNRLLKRLAAY